MAENGGGHGTRAVIAALLANLGIAAAKLVGFVLTGASSMLAEAFHSVADSGNQAMLIVGGRVAERGPDRQHPFGHGRVRYFAAFLVAVVLFTLGSLFSLYEGFEKLRHPHELESAGVAIAILLVALVLEGLSLRTAVREADPLRGQQGWWSFIRTTKKPELAVVLLEDTAAELGLTFALAGVGLAAVTGDPLWDALGTLAIGALLAVSSSGSRCTACWSARPPPRTSRRRSARRSCPPAGWPTWSSCAPCTWARTRCWWWAGCSSTGSSRPTTPPG
jgi:cation diffusion facilitator family transporter